VSDPFTTASAAILRGPGTTTGVIAQGSASHTRRVLLSLGVEVVNLTSGVSTRITTAQFTTIGGLKPKAAAPMVSVATYTLERRINDDGYAETWEVT
jgi:hypothetical protein